MSLDRLMATIRALTLIALCVFNTSLQHTQTNRKLAPPAKRGCGKYGRALAILTRAVNL